jgi:alkaline phosphatase
MSRRKLMAGGALWLGAGGRRVRGQDAPAVRFGLVTDVHYGDKPQLGTRFYRESLGKLSEGVERLREGHVDFLVNLGDLVDAATDVDTERAWLKQAAATLAGVGAETHCVLGNHCVQTLRKEQFLAVVGAKRSYYSFDRHGIHFSILDGCYRKDGVSYDAGNFDWKDTEIPEEQRAWPRRDLEAASAPLVVFVHQRLDSDYVYSVASAVEIRRILEESRKVAAVFQGHSHKNNYREIDGVPYCTMRAVVQGSGAENSGYALVSVYRNGAVAVEGFRDQRSYAAVPKG